MRVKQNIGDRDRAARMLVGGALAVIFFPLPRNTASLIVGVASVILFVSSLTGWSLLYFVLRISTRSDKDAKPIDHS
jgi:hypothetical protein